MRLPSSLVSFGYGSPSHVISDETASALQKAAEFSAFHVFREAAWLALNILETVQKTRFIHPYYTALTEAVCNITQEVISYDLPLSRATNENAVNLIKALRAVNELVLAASSESWCHKHFLTDKDVATMQKAIRDLTCLTADSTGLKSKSMCNIGVFRRLDVYGSVCELLSHVSRRRKSHSISSSSALVEGNRGLLSYLLCMVSACFSKVYFVFLLGLPAYYASRANYVGSTPEPDYFPSRHSIEIVDLDTDAICSPSASTAENPAVGAWISMCHSLVEEWKAFRVLSALTLGAGLALFQIPSVNGDLLICFSAYFTLICMLMSTIYATIEIIYFKSWKDMRVIANWFHEIQRCGHKSAWNAWILFALPALWTAWGAFFFLICIFLLIWRSEPGTISLDPSIPIPSTSLEELIGFRISLTVVMVLALMYLTLMLVTFRRIQHDGSGGLKDSHIYVV